jgi:FtsH-binding integral membrane protein
VAGGGGDLIAYDTQKLHKMAQNPELHGSADGATLMTKVSIIGALRLYLDFVNLFLFLLRIFGGRR